MTHGGYQTCIPGRLRAGHARLSGRAILRVWLTIPLAGAAPPRNLRNKKPSSAPADGQPRCLSSGVERTVIVRPHPGRYNRALSPTTKPIAAPGTRLPRLVRPASTRSWHDLRATESPRWYLAQQQSFARSPPSGSHAHCGGAAAFYEGTVTMTGLRARFYPCR